MKYEKDCIDDDGIAGCQPECLHSRTLRAYP
jgi:hypothetical protein